MNTLLEFYEFNKPDRNDREPKKSKSYYYTKRININKIELRDICELMNLSFEDLNFLASGSFGNAYKIGDKVLKITTDKAEAQSVSKLLGKNIKFIVKYYSVKMYKLKNEYVYIILMDYVQTITDFIKNNIPYKRHESYINFITDIIYIIWDNNLIKKSDLIEKLKEKEWEINSKLGYFLIDKFLELSKDMKFKVDFHIDNIGINKDRLVLFDFRGLKSPTKFDSPEILK